MSKSFRKDLTGQRFGRLTVIEFVPTTGRRSMWKCLCECGDTVVVEKQNLLSGHTQSCGCLRKEISKKFIQENVNKIRKKKSSKYFLHGKRLKSIWRGMKERCYNQNAVNYKYYGGRDIKICDEWRNSFQAFYDWAMSNGYADDLTIDRIDVNGDYEPSNCRWSDTYKQNRNRRSNIIIQYNGVDMCLSDIARELNLPIKALQNRYKRGDRGDRLFRPLEK